jgi:phage tail-like protein
MPTGDRNDPFNARNFRVEVDGIRTEGLLTVLGIEADVTGGDYREGNEKLFIFSPRKLPGEAKFTNIVLKRGMTSDLSSWEWMQETLDGKLTRKAMSVALLSDAGAEVLRFNFRETWPVKWSGPILNAETSDIAIETLEIAHEGFSISSISGASEMAVPTVDKSP